LSGENLQKFYIDDFASQSVEEIITTIRISERFRKMLVIGHRGCGKSTILNKIAQELKTEYHVVAFSAGDVINMMDVETVDILLTTYLQLLESVKNSKDIFDRLFDKFNDFYKLFNKKIALEETGIELLGTLSFKFKVEPESREVIRKALFDQIKHLQENLSKACQQIQERQKKEILIIIDDLDKLPPQLAERIFFENFFMLTLPDVKIIYIFPLDTYYDEAFISVTDKYEVMFIPVVNLSVFQGCN
jgi:AAA+ ATPase superfamily predicted ATPase